MLNVQGADGGAFDDFDDCLSCDECAKFSGQAALECDQECKFCEACAGEYAGTAMPYRPDGYPAGPLNCHIDCWGQTREAARCVRWSQDEMPLAPEEVDGEGNLVTVRGGHVGIAGTNSLDACRFRADYRAKRVFPDGSASNQNNATEKGLGIRCARSLTDDERAALMGHASASNFEHLNPALAIEESAEFNQPVYEVPVEPASGARDAEEEPGERDEVPAEGAESSEP